MGLKTSLMRTAMKLFAPIVRFCFLFGFDVNRAKHVLSPKNVLHFINTKRAFKQQLGHNSPWTWGRSVPILWDRFDQGGTMSGAYFHQDLLVARWIYESRPIRHLDIGSRTDGFIAHVAVFREIEMLDIRDIQSNVKNIVFKRADLMQLPEELVGRFDSVSSLHAIEHFGLGRYGDPIDANGHLKALDNIHQLLQPGGVFYFSTPIGPLRVEFNAHRVFSVSYLLDAFKDKFSIESFAYVDDQGDLHTDCSLTASHEVESNFGCTYGCGIFVLRKIA